jgi:hypothetical protein
MLDASTASPDLFFMGIASGIFLEKDPSGECIVPSTSSSIAHTR